MKKMFHNRVFLSWMGMTVGSLLYCFVIVFILDKGEFYAGGVTGICQIIANNIFHRPILKSILVASANIPLFLIGYKKVSKRFAILSLASVLLQTIALFLFQKIYDNGFDPFKNFVGDDSYGKVTLSVLGGVLAGLACGITLKYGASTGGMDIVSQAFSFKTDKSFAYVSFSLDLVVVVLGIAVNNFNINVGIYTIIRMAMSHIVLDRIYKIYNYHKITIITKNVDEVNKAIIERFDHGITIIQAKGGYSGETKYVLECVCLSYEVEEYRRLLKNVDPKAFIYLEVIKGIQGKFKKKAIS